MRKAFWTLFLMAMPGLLVAQQNQPSQQASQEKQTQEKQAQEQQPATQEPAKPANAVTRPLYPPAPKLGHPLDPADVDVLTGKNKQADRSGSNSYGVYAYPAGGSRWGQSIFTTPGDYSRQGPVVPFAFGNVNGRRFFLFGGPGTGAPLVFLSNGAHRSFFLLAPGFSFF